MPRCKRKRRICFMPQVSHFAPIGGSHMPVEVILNLDELEALRLKDFEEMNQEEAAKQMQISQPTFHRLLLGARKKTADALVNNKIIKIRGGFYKMDENEVEKPEIRRGYGQGFGRGFRAGRLGGVGPGGFCICPACGNKQQKVPGIPCTEVKCVKCGALMIRN